MKWGAWFIAEAPHTRLHAAVERISSRSWIRARTSQPDSRASWLRVFRAKVKDARTRFRSSPRPSRARVHGNRTADQCDSPRSVFSSDEKEESSRYCRSPWFSQARRRSFPVSVFRSLDSFPSEAISRIFVSSLLVFFPRENEKFNSVVTVE